MRRFALKAAITLLVTYALFTVYAAASALWNPGGTLGISTDYGAGIRSVSSGGPAARTGIVAGDRIDLGATPFIDRRFVSGVGASPRIGQRIYFRLIHGGVARNVSLTAERDEMAPGDRSSLVLQCVASFVFIAVGASIVLLRPSLATWGFGLYCLLLLPTMAAPLRLPSAATAVSAILFFDVFQNLGVAGVVVFALEFPRPYDTPWRRSIRRAVPAIFIVLALMTAYPDVANLLIGTGAAFENRILQLVAGSMFGLALFVLIDTYRRIERDERERLRWVLLGFGIGTVTSYVGNTLLFSSLIPISPPAWIVNVLISLDVVVPLAVAHAVVRNRVLDIDFVIGRALLYAALTTVIAAVFGLLDWAFGHVLEDFRLSQILEAALSVGIAFAFDAFHKRAETTIDAIFFRKRREAESRMTDLARGVSHARSAEAVARALVDDAAAILELTSAALFLRVDRSFVRNASLGWRETDRTSVNDADDLVLAVGTHRESLRLAERTEFDAHFPSGAFAPIVAVSIVSRGELAGFVLYGAHAVGADIDAIELTQLERLAYAAADVLDELETERLRVDNALQHATIDELRARLKAAARPP